MNGGYRQVLATRNEQEILYNDIEDIEKNRSCEINEVPESDTKGFMLDKPEPVTSNVEFGVFELGEIKGTLRRKDLYEDR